MDYNQFFKYRLNHRKKWFGHLQTQTMTLQRSRQRQFIDFHLKLESMYDHLMRTHQRPRL